MATAASWETDLQYWKYSDEEFVLSAGWTQDANHYYLLVDLPHDVIKKGLEIQSLGIDHINVKGERRVNGNKSIPFEQKFKAPRDANIEGSIGDFQGEILRVSIPKAAPIKEAEAKTEADQAKTENRGTTADSIYSFTEEKKNDRQKKPNRETNGAAAESINEEKNDQQKKPNREINGAAAGSVDKEKNDEQKRQSSSDDKMRGEGGGEQGGVLGGFSMNLRIMIAAALAFSAGVLVSRIFDSSTKKRNV